MKNIKITFSCINSFLLNVATTCSLVEATRSLITSSLSLAIFVHLWQCGCLWSAWTSSSLQHFMSSQTCHLLAPSCHRSLILPPSYHKVHTLGGCGSLWGIQPVRPLGRVLQQPPIVDEQEFLIIECLDLVQLRHILLVCAAHVETIHFYKATSELAHVTWNLDSIEWEGNYLSGCAPWSAPLFLSQNASFHSPLPTHGSSKMWENL